MDICTEKKPHPNNTDRRSTQHICLKKKLIQNKSINQSKHFTKVISGMHKDAKRRRFRQKPGRDESAWLESDQDDLFAIAGFSRAI